MPSVLLVGTPNSGKTALFNRLTGLNQRVANYPGITCLLYTSPSPRDVEESRMPSSA